jgi:fructose-1,6-bisphosphatase/inositol monophosphatase family enzyme
MRIEPFDWTTLKRCVRAMTDTVRFIQRFHWENPKRCFEPVQLPCQEKAATVIDIAAEAHLSSAFRAALHGWDAVVVGEESMAGFASGHSGLAILVDAVDGTRLLQHGWNNWCSAATVWRQQTGEILASFVAEPDGVCYFATRSRLGKARLMGRQIEFVPMTAPATTAGGKSCAFYGYKRERFAAFGRELPAGVGTVFTVGGNPALVRMVDGYQRVDAVLEPIGQSPHDMVAGLFLCQRAGVTVLGYDGALLDLARLFGGDLRRRVPFVAAWDAGLAQQLLRESAGMAMVA